MPKFFDSLLLLLGAVELVIAGNVLVLCPLSSQSHRNVMAGIYSGLAERGHNITVVTSGKPSNTQKNVREILVFEAFDYFPKLSTLEIRKGGALGMLSMDITHMFDYCRKFYDHPEVQALLNEEFDVILYDGIGNQCVYGLIHKLRSSYITVSTCAPANVMTGPHGNRLPPSFVPDISLPYTDSMTFPQRILNFLMGPVTSVGFHIGVSETVEIYREYVGQDTPDAYEMAANASLLLINSHLSFGTPTPTLPDVIEFGGAHCRPGKPLPKELEEFVSGAKDGLILFSLGSIVKPHELPDEIRKVFVNTFAKLKQRVLWKWPLSMDDLPPNVKLFKWVPQQDVLAHPNTKLFITHGGLLSTQEAIYHGVPMIYLPVFGDQDGNANLATLHGIGLNLEILDVTAEQMESAIKQILGDPSYLEKIKRLSVIFRDQPETPKERVTFWVEYVMRHGGALHLRSAARKLNFFQYYSLDVIAVIAISIFVVLWLLKLAFTKIVRVVLSAFASQGETKKTK